MVASHRIFKAGAFTSWETMCQDVDAFLTSVGKSNIIGLTQSEDKDNAVLIVWYWR